MNGTADSEEPHMRGLIETLDDCRQFYLDAVARSSGEARALNDKKADCFAAMLAEISQWQAHLRDPAVGTTGQAPPLAFVTQSSGPGPREPPTHDDFSVLLHRINRIHDELFLMRQTPARTPGQRPEAGCGADPDLRAAHSANEEDERHRFRR